MIFALGSVIFALGTVIFALGSLIFAFGTVIFAFGTVFFAFGSLIFAFGCLIFAFHINIPYLTIQTHLQSPPPINLNQPNQHYQHNLKIPYICTKYPQ